MIRLSFILFLSFFPFGNIHGATTLLFNESFLSTPKLHPLCNDDRCDVFVNQENASLAINTSPIKLISLPEKRKRSRSLEDYTAETSSQSKHFKDISYETPPTTPPLHNDEIVDSGSFFISPATSLAGSSFKGSSFNEISSEEPCFETFLPLSPYAPPKITISAPNDHFFPLPLFPIIDETPGSFLPEHKTRLRDNFKMEEEVIQIAEILNISLRIDSTDPDILLQHERIQPYAQKFLENGGKIKTLKDALSGYKTQRTEPVRSEKYGTHTIDPQTFRTQDGQWRTIIQRLKLQDKKTFKSPNHKYHKPYYPPLSEDERREKRHAAREKMRARNATKAPDGETLEEMEKRILTPLQEFIKEEQHKFKANPKDYQKMDLESFQGIVYEFFKDALKKGEYYAIFHDDGYVCLVPESLDLSRKNHNDQTTEELLSLQRNPASLSGEPMEWHHITMTDIGTSLNLYPKIQEMMQEQKKTFVELNLSLKESITQGCFMLLVSEENHTYGIHPYNILSQVHHPDRSIFDKARKRMNDILGKTHRISRVKRESPIS